MSKTIIILIEEMIHKAIRLPLLEELERKVEFRFVGVLKSGKKNPLHKNAHFLSRVYKKEIFDNMGILRK